MTRLLYGVSLVAAVAISCDGQAQKLPPEAAPTGSAASTPHVEPSVNSGGDPSAAVVPDAPRSPPQDTECIADARRHALSFAKEDASKSDPKREVLVDDLSYVYIEDIDGDETIDFFVTDVAQHEWHALYLSNAGCVTHAGRFQFRVDTFRRLDGENAGLRSWRAFEASGCAGQQGRAVDYAWDGTRYAVTREVECGCPSDAPGADRALECESSRACVADPLIHALGLFMRDADDVDPEREVFVNDLFRTDIGDIDGDGIVDVLVTDGESPGAMFHRLYESNKGCWQLAGGFSFSDGSFALADPDVAGMRAWRAFEGNGCAGTEGFAVRYEWDGTRYEEAKRVKCDCVDDEPDADRPVDCDLHLVDEAKTPSDAAHADWNPPVEQACSAGLWDPEGHRPLPHVYSACASDAECAVSSISVCCGNRDFAIRADSSRCHKPHGKSADCEMYCGDDPEPVVAPPEVACVESRCQLVGSDD